MFVFLTLERIRGYQGQSKPFFRRHAIVGQALSGVANRVSKASLSGIE